MATNNQNMRGGSSEQHSKAGKMGGEARSTQSSTQSSTQKSGSSNRGFASMDPEQQRRIASEGGKASHASGRGHEWTSEEARAAGRKGGQASGSNRTKQQ
ncbi:KGG domain-containing protein [Hymenobacter latericus]|uniref:KGG domain-containing protein n=1 Tax=Hymenobacter sp. YIM 151858-1 TaxID=2987688 RepID=UPI002227E824|nr:KGG domain-containing protein [Hymenobacter sp. YIM 151858-1]UYZ58965.1 hypothetical protein OIS50_18130 [Hymenobacter sp. YIM 151858-1]